MSFFRFFHLNQRKHTETWNVRPQKPELLPRVCVPAPSSYFLALSPFLLSTGAANGISLFGFLLCDTKGTPGCRGRRGLQYTRDIVSLGYCDISNTTDSCLCSGLEHLLSCSCCSTISQLLPSFWGVSHLKPPQI